MLKRSWLIISIVLLTTVSALGLLRHALVGWVAESYLNTLLSTSVDIKSSTLSFSPLQIALKDITIYGKTGIAEYKVDTSLIDISPTPLLKKKLLVNFIQINGFEELISKNHTVLQSSKPNLDFSNKIDLNFLTSDFDPAPFVKKENMSFYKKELQLADKIKKLPATWSKSNLDEAFTTLSSPNIDIRKLSTQQDITEAISFTAKMKSKINDVSSRLLSQKQIVFEDVSLIQRQINFISPQDSDYAQALSPFSVDSPSVKHVTQALFGNDIRQKAQPLLDVMTMINAIVYGIHTQKVTSVTDQTLPSLWIKQITLSGKTVDGEFLFGSAQHITSDQYLTNRPTTFEFLTGSTNEPTSILSASVDVRNQPISTLSYTHNSYALPTITLSPNQDKITIHDPILKISFTFNTTHNTLLDGNFTITASTKKVDYDSNKRFLSFSGLIYNELNKIFPLELTGQIGGTLDRPSMITESNLDTRIKTKLNAFYTNKMNDIGIKIRQKIDVLSEQTKRDLSKQNEALKTEVLATLTAQLDRTKLLSQLWEEKRTELELIRGSDN